MDSKEFEYSKLCGKIREIFKTQKNFAKAIGISSTSLNLKLNNKAEFKQKEVLEALKVLYIPNDEIVAYFFSEKVQKNEYRA